jgi:Fic-DOC domain mobile mystery protein B
VSELGREPPGATPLPAEDLAALRLSWVTTRDELNQAEADNILRGRLWAFRRRGQFWYLEPEQLHRLHRQMFGAVWSWAGAQRRRETNIGIDWQQIAVALRNLCDDTLAQIGDATNLAYPADELAMRFHHRLVLIHPYPNGNGRHSRLATDLLGRDLGLDEFSWGTGGVGRSEDIATAAITRQRYLAALRAADSRRDVTDLIAFAKS